MNPQDEPFGHRGHPTDAEMARAAKVAIRLERAIKRLVEHGFSEDEAVGFIAGLATAHAAAQGESWLPGEIGAVGTIQRIRAGRGAKEWSLNALILALFDVGDLTAE